MVRALASLWLALIALPAVAQPRARLHGVASWAYQLQRIDLEALVASHYDLLVIDPMAEDGKPRPAADIARLRARADRPRIVLAYLSIGEAESYRAYWQPEWKKKPPRWLGKPNPYWQENYNVRFWDPEWQAYVVGPGGTLDGAITQGFDGVYLDRLDAFEVWGPDGKGDRGEASGKAAMVAFVERIARAAREGRGQDGFLIVGQNASTLAASPAYLAAIDAIALEDVFTEQDRRVPRRHVESRLDELGPARRRGLPLFAVDYLPARRARERFVKEARGKGLIPFAAPSRWLDRLPLPPIP